MDTTALRKQIRDSAEQRIRTAAPELQSRLRKAAPVSEGGGDLRDSISVTADGLTTHVQVAVEYATYTTEGTDPHPIVARNARALRFFWPQVGPPQPRYYRSVMHPGTKPNDWYQPVLGTWSDIVAQ